MTGPHDRFGPRAAVLGVALLALLGLAMIAGRVQASASTERWGMPDPKVVIANAKGSDRLDQLAQMSATLNLLSDVVASLAPKYRGGSWVDPRDNTLYAAYLNSSLRVDEAAYAITGSEYYPDPHSKRNRWQERSNAYRGDAAFIQRNMRRYVPAPLAERYLALEGRTGRPTALAEWKAKDRQLGLESFVYQLAGPALRGVGMGQLMAYAAVAAVVLFGLLIVTLWGMSEARRRVDFADASMTRYLGGSLNHRMHTFTGVVLSPTKTSETRVYGGGGSGGYTSSVSSHVTTKDQFFLSNKGRETPIQLSNWDLPVRDGHVVSAVWAIPEGHERGPYVFFRNHTTGEIHFDDSAVKKLTQCNTGCGCLLLPLFPVFLIIGSSVSGSRMRAFKQVQCPRLIAQLDEAASGLQ